MIISKWRNLNIETCSAMFQFDALQDGEGQLAVLSALRREERGGDSLSVWAGQKKRWLIIPVLPACLHSTSRPRAGCLVMCLSPATWCLAPHHGCPTHAGCRKTTTSLLLTFGAKLSVTVTLVSGVYSLSLLIKIYDKYMAFPSSRLWACLSRVARISSGFCWPAALSVVCEVKL